MAIRTTNKQLLDEVFVISRIIKVSVRVITLTLNETKKATHVCVSSLTARKTKRANLT